MGHSSSSQRVPLHPVTVKCLKKGHPWVTPDKFSDRFPSNTLFLIGTNSKHEEVALLLHDPEHKNIKARVWDRSPPFGFSAGKFAIVLTSRMEEAFSKRLQSKYFVERDNLFLVFGEADLLPGLFIQKLGDNLLIQYYALYWKKLEKHLFKALAQILVNNSKTSSLSIWVQERNLAQKVKYKKITLPGMRKLKHKNQFCISEFGIKYSLKLDHRYDFGIYTDMASIRKVIIPYFKNRKNVLNLYSYTGAFSLTALKAGADKVVSVDLSEEYHRWLAENLEINPTLEQQKHYSLKMPADKALLKYKNENKKFDLIICDPPTASTSRSKKTAILKTYDALLPEVLNVLSEKGVIIIFINSYKTSRTKFIEKIETILRSSNKNFKILKKLGLSEDCPTCLSFPEGDYLKGCVIRLL